MDTHVRVTITGDSSPGRGDEGDEVLKTTKSQYHKQMYDIQNGRQKVESNLSGGGVGGARLKPEARGFRQTQICSSEAHTLGIETTNVGVHPISTVVSTHYS